jgi:hypothetical protein
MPPSDQKEAVLLVSAALKNPEAVLTYMVKTDLRLTLALELATTEFDSFHAAELAKEASVILGVIADALKSKALTAPAKPRRPTRKAIAAAHAALAPPPSDEVVPF